METEFDVIVIGGGPAGMMAAARASARGRSVVLLEKNKKLGKKLGITGGGRCNVTNNKPVVREMLSEYKGSGKYLFSTFMQHGVKETIEWFKERGVDFVEENEGRLFPDTLKAETIRAIVQREIEKQKVTVKKGETVAKITFDNKTKRFLVKTGSDTFTSDSCIVATGGTSRPETGSTGEGFRWLKALGHSIIPNNMSLVPLVVNKVWVSKLAGVTLPEVKISVYSGSKKQSAHSGKLLFSHVGVTGPTILNLSKEVGELLEDGPVILKIDLLPDLDAGELKIKFRDLLTSSSNKKIKNVLNEIVPTAVGNVILEEAKVGEEDECHSVSKESRVKILTLLKALPLPIKKLLGSDKAVISSGGVMLDEIDFKTMESRVVPRLYLVGDVLNIDRPSGGYSLQLCWSTGVVAGDNA